MKRLLAIGVVLGSVIVVEPWNPATVLAAPNVSVTQSIPAQTLIGRETAVELTITNTAPTDKAFNLALAVRLPLGVHVSSSDISPSDVITETDAAGNPTGTVVAWENIVDVRAGGLFRFGYSLAHDLGVGPDLWEVGETISAPVEAFVSDIEAPPVPTITAQTTGNQVTAVASNFTQSTTAAGSTTLVPFLLTKSQPEVEGELLRGVHDHQTVYTLTAETGSQGGVDIGLVSDWIPAGMEFLGCGTEDNSSVEEYPGAGPLNPGHAPALTEPCFTPELVETVDSGLPAGLPAGVYTHVVWDIGASIEADTVVSMSYVAAIAQRENTMNWRAGTAPGPASLEQASNIDNNNGAFTTQVDEGASYTNFVSVESTFEGSDTVVEAQASVEAVDLSIHKFVDDPTIEQGAISNWTMLIETSEYVVEGGIADMAVTDVTPDGLCPIGSVHPGCSATDPDPVPPYTSTSYDPGTGQTTLEWDLSAVSLGRSQTFTVSFATETLAEYVNGLPVSAQDNWTNTVDQTATTTTFGPFGPNFPPGFATNPTSDDSSRNQSGTAVSFRKDVGRPPEGAECGDGTDVLWNPDALDLVGPGDRVCFRLTVIPPEGLDQIQSTLVDYLPPGLRYEDGTATGGPDNEVPVDIVEGPAVDPDPPAGDGQRLTWNLIPDSSIQPAQLGQVVFAAILDDGDVPDLGTSGDSFVNEARYSYENVNGEIFVDADSASVTFDEAHLTLTKGIGQIDSPLADPVSFDPPADSVRDVGGGTAVTYRIDVTNDGTRDAIGVQVSDLLAVNGDDITPEDAVCGAISSISNSGACDPGPNDVNWSDLTVPAGTTVQLTYVWTMPDPVSIATSWINEAGVVQYRSTTNTGTDYTYIPRDNIDPSREPDANTDRARDQALLFSPGISMTKNRTTSITEDGNAATDQATIGEVVSFAIESRQSADTGAENYRIVDDLTGTGMQLVAGSARFQATLTAPGAPCDYTGVPEMIGPPLTELANGIEVFDPGSVLLDDQDGCIVFMFDAVVEDLPNDAGEALNVRPGVVRNEATLTYDAAPEPGIEVPRTVTAGVDTQIVEPNITIDKRSSAPDVVFPGAIIDYALLVTNQSDSQVSTAHDLVVVDDFSGAAVATVIDPGTGTVSGNTISWTLSGDPDGDGNPGLSPGASITLTYRVQLEGDLDAGSTLSNTATVTATSIEGGNAGERTPSSTCSPTICPGYIDTDTETLTVGGPILAKSVADPLTTFGDEVTYQIEALFPAHLDFGPSPVTITDDLAEGATTLLETVNVVCVGCTDAERGQYIPPNPGVDDPVWSLAIFPASNVARRVTITYLARTENDLALSAGAELINTATLDFGNGELTSQAQIEIAEPDISLAKRVGSTLESPPRDTTDTSPVPALPGSTLSYELAVTNDGDWTAYDVTVGDEPDSESSTGNCLGDSRLAVVDVPNGVGWVVDDGTLGTANACLGWTIPSLLPHQTIVITYQLSVADSFPRSELIIGNEFVNMADVPEYFALELGQRIGNPEVRAYPLSPIDDEGFVNLNGSALGDLVWLDLDGDGFGPDTGDTDEPGLANITVTVTPSSGTPIDFVTDANGRWNTDDGGIPPDWLAAGDYTITVDTADPDFPQGLVNSADPDGTNDSTTTTALAENDVDLTQDFGYTGSGSVGDFVWLDFNGDGVQDPGEPGIPDVDVTVTWYGVDNVLGTGDDVDFGPVTTDADGFYLVAGLPSGAVRVDVIEATLPAGVTPTFDLDGGLDGVTGRLLAPGEQATDVDFGYRGTASVGDLVWFDLDANGAINGPLEAGIPGVDVVVTWAGVDETLGTSDDVVFPTATTDGGGLYLVTNLPAGSVAVDVDTATLPSGLTQTFDADGTLDDGTVRLLGIGTVDLLADFGYNGANTIGDLVWFDVDNDGNGPDSATPDSEPGIPNQLVTVRWAGPNDLFGDGDDVVLPPTTTDADGRWSVGGVPDGSVRVTLTGGPANTLTVTYDRDGNNDLTTDFSITGDDPDFDFGLTGTGSVGDTVWLDLDGDGVQDGAEPGIGDVTVTLQWAGWNGVFGDLDDVEYPDALTDASGAYGFANLPPGSYRVTIDTDTLPVPLTETHELDGTLDASSVVVLSTAVPDRDDVDFGFAGSASVGDTVWLDRNTDGARQPALEPGIPNVTLTATWGGFDGVVGTGGDDIVLPADITDADGHYLFQHLPPGEVQIDVSDAALLTAGLDRTSDPDGTLDASTIRLLAVGQIDLAADFGYLGANTIGDLVWYDIDNDGNGPDSAAPDDEPGIPNQLVNVRWAGTNGIFGDSDDLLFLPTTTGPNGRWSVDGLPNGSVRVTLTGAPADTLTVTHDRDGNNDLTTEFSITGDDPDFDFGLTGTAIVGDRVWLDLDRDGAQDVGEPGLDGVDVTVRWAGWNGVFEVLPVPGSDDVVYPVQTTGATGGYEIGNLPPGRYRVTVDATTLPDGVEPTFDLDGIQTAHVAERVVAVGEVARNVDFGYAGTAQLGDFVWWDLDGDMIQDVAEPGIPAITVTAVWSGSDGDLGTIDDKVLPPVTTAPDGSYEFTNLPSGDYRVTVLAASLPNGLTATFDLDGGGDNTAVRTIATGTIANNVDFGFVGTLTVGDLVWDDVNLDSIRGAGEPAIAGASVTLQYLGRDGVVGGGDDVFFTAVTANPPLIIPSGRVTEAATPNPGDPFYSIPGLVPGSYIATLDPSSLPAGVTPVSDLDGGDPLTTIGSLNGTNLDVDFVVFQNAAPLPPVPGTAVRVACGANVVVDPTAGVTDANGDDLSLVPGSIVAPPGVTVAVLPNGDLRITATSAAADGSQVRWMVQDEHGATTTVALIIDVTGSCQPIPATGANTADSSTWALLVFGVGITLFAITRRRRA